MNTRSIAYALGCCMYSLLSHVSAGELLANPTEAGDTSPSQAIVPSAVWRPEQTQSVPPPGHKNSGFIDFNFYPYTTVNTDNAVSVNTLVNLPHDFQYFGFINFERQPSEHALTETAGVFTEQNLRWQPWEAPVSLATQVMIRTGAQNNDVLRFGPRFAVHDFERFGPLLEKCHLQYWVAIYGAEFDYAAGYQWQMEHVFQWKVLPELLGDRVYIGGFADHVIDHASGTDATWVEEAQLGVRIAGEWFLVAEQRYNGFRRGSEASLGLGVEYVVRFK